jgi:hypothetical protein
MLRLAGIKGGYMDIVFSETASVDRDIKRQEALKKGRIVYDCWWAKVIGGKVWCPFEALQGAVRTLPLEDVLNGKRCKVCQDCKRYESVL